MTRPGVGVARLIYVVGLVLASATALNGLTDESPVEWVVGPAMAVAIWWIAAGIAIRMGVTPRDLFGWVGSWFIGTERDPS